MDGAGQAAAKTGCFFADGLRQALYSPQESGLRGHSAPAAETAFAQLCQHWRPGPRLPRRTRQRPRNEEYANSPNSNSAGHRRLWLGAAIACALHAGWPPFIVTHTIQATPRLPMDSGARLRICRLWGGCGLTMSRRRSWRGASMPMIIKSTFCEQRRHHPRRHAALSWTRLGRRAAQLTWPDVQRHSNRSSIR